MERECIVLIHITVHLKVESALNREASYFWTVPVALSMALLPGSADRLMRTPHAEKHTSGVLESRRVTTYCSTERKDPHKRQPLGLWRQKIWQRECLTPFCCTMKCLTSLICDRFPNTRVASKTASILELSKSFSSTAMTEGQAGEDITEAPRQMEHTGCSHTHTHTLVVLHCEMCVCWERTTELSPW